MAQRWARPLVLIGLAAMLVGLGACREDEQDRLLSYQPGKYQGQPDTPLKAGVRAQLRQRIGAQRATFAAALPARRPAAGAASPSDLGDRVRAQSSSTTAVAPRTLRSGLPRATLDAIRSRLRNSRTF